MARNSLLSSHYAAAAASSNPAAALSALVLSMSNYPNSIYVHLSRFYSNFILSDFVQIFSRFCPDFVQIFKRFNPDCNIRYSDLTEKVLEGLKKIFGIFDICIKIGQTCQYPVKLGFL